jgi:hypothetical protein
MIYENAGTVGSFGADQGCPTVCTNTQNTLFGCCFGPVAYLHVGRGGSIGFVSSSNKVAQRCGILAPCRESGSRSLAGGIEKPIQGSKKMRTKVCAKRDEKRPVLVLIKEYIPNQNYRDKAILAGGCWRTVQAKPQKLEMRLQAFRVRALGKV